MALRIDKSKLAAFKSVVRTCKARGCDRQHYARGYCRKHYLQVRRHGRLSPELEHGVVRVCKVKNCGRTDTLYGYCLKHARQIRYHGRLTPERERLVGFTGCAVVGCKEEHGSRGLCHAHYGQARWIEEKAARSKKGKRGK